MDSELHFFVREANNLLVSERAKHVRSILLEKHLAGGANEWYYATLALLFVNLTTEYGLIVHNTVEEMQGIRTRLVPRVLAWRARNILEIWIWIVYCLKDKHLCRRFYEDKRRDEVDWSKQIESLLDLVKTVCMASPSSAATWAESWTKLSESNRLSRKQAAEEGVADLDDPYTRVHYAARTVAPEMGIAFSSLYRFLSKLAHPSALVLLALPNDEAIRACIDSMLNIAAGVFLLAFRAMEVFVIPETVNEPLVPTPIAAIVNPG